MTRELALLLFLGVITLCYFIALLIPDGGLAYVIGVSLLKGAGRDEETLIIRNLMSLVTIYVLVYGIGNSMMMFICVDK